MEHNTVVPNESPAPQRSIEYDANSAHDRYMCALRLDMIRAGVIESGV